MISCVGSMPMVSKALTYPFKRNDSLIFMVGVRKDECGGSAYYQLHHELGSNVPQPDLATMNKEIHTVVEAIQESLVLAAHDISDGGLATALAEMSFANDIGVNINLSAATDAVTENLSVDKQLFSESGGFILEVTREQAKLLRQLFIKQQVPLFCIGETTKDGRLRMNEVIDLPIKEAKTAWEDGLRMRLL